MTKQPLAPGLFYTITVAESGQLFIEDYTSDENRTTLEELSEEFPEHTFVTSFEVRAYLPLAMFTDLTECLLDTQDKEADLLRTVITRAQSGESPAITPDEIEQFAATLYDEGGE